MPMSDAAVRIAAAFKTAMGQYRAAITQLLNHCQQEKKDVRWRSHLDELDALLKAMVAMEIGSPIAAATEDRAFAHACDLDQLAEQLVLEGDAYKPENRRELSTFCAALQGWWKRAQLTFNR